MFSWGIDDVFTDVCNLQLHPQGCCELMWAAQNHQQRKADCHPVHICGPVPAELAKMPSAMATAALCCMQNQTDGPCPKKMSSTKSSTDHYFLPAWYHLQTYRGCTQSLCPDNQQRCWTGLASIQTPREHRSRQRFSLCSKPWLAISRKLLNLKERNKINYKIIFEAYILHYQHAGLNYYLCVKYQRQFTFTYNYFSSAFHSAGSDNIQISVAQTLIWNPNYFSNNLLGSKKPSLLSGLCDPHGISLPDWDILWSYGKQN